MSVLSVPGGECQGESVRSGGSNGSNGGSAQGCWAGGGCEVKGGWWGGSDGGGGPGWGSAVGRMR